MILHHANELAFSQAIVKPIHNFKNKTKGKSLCAIQWLDGLMVKILSFRQEDRGSIPGLDAIQKLL